MFRGGERTSDRALESDCCAAHERKSAISSERYRRTLLASGTAEGTINVEVDFSPNHMSSKRHQDGNRNGLFQWKVGAKGHYQGGNRLLPAKE